MSISIGQGVTVDISGGTTTTGILNAADGTAAAPSYSFAAQPSTGWWRPNSVSMYNTVNGTVTAQFQTTITSVLSPLDIGLQGDATLYRDAANTLAQRNGVNAQAFRLYNTYTDASNYERGSFNWVGNVFQLTTQNLGTGTAREISLFTGGLANLYLGTNGTSRWVVNTSGNLVAFADNAYDIGAASANRPRNIYVAGNYYDTAPTTYTGTTYTVLAADNDVIANASATSTVTLPAAASNTGRPLYIKTIAAFTVVSASSNVVPLAGGAAGTAILAATAGKWARLKSDGTNWVIMAGN